MISVAALKMQQFGVQFYQASLTAKDIDKLVRFEVLNYGEQGTAPGLRGSTHQSTVRWDLLERRIASNEKAYQRQIIRKKIDELVAWCSRRARVVVRSRAASRAASRARQRGDPVAVVPCAVGGCRARR